MSAARAGKNSAALAGTGTESADPKNGQHRSQVKPPPWESPQWLEAVGQNPGLAPFFDSLEFFVELPEAVPKLRDLVLDLAVRGKLVEQDAEDEPATELLLRIHESKTSAGQKKKPKPIADDEKPFDLPQSWCWTRFHEVAEIASNLVKPQSFPDMPHVAPNHIEKYSGRLLDYRTVAEDKVKSSKHRFYAGHLLYSKIRPNLSKAVVIDFDGLCSADMYPVNPLIDRDYLLRYILSACFVRMVVKSDTRVAMPKTNQAELNQVLVAVPPLAEQRRIVSKVEGLMSLCDTLESQRRTRESVRERASRSVLASLTSASASLPAGTSRATSPSTASGETLQSSWQRLSDHFEVLLDQPSGPAHLRQSILQLAVQGKLVPQDPNDEPATTVVAQIAEELKQKVESGEMKRPKKLKPLDEIEKPHGLPDGWCWARFPELGIFGRGKSRHRPRNDPKLYEKGKYPLVQTGDVARANGVIETHTGMYGDFGLEQSKLWQAGTMCITIAANIADTGILGFEACIPDSVVGFIPLGPFETAKYFEFYMRTMQSNLESYAPSTAQKNINLGILETVLIPLPPLAEQKRIVSKVSVLLSQLDELSARLRCRQSTTDALLTALIHQILEGADR